MKQKSNRKTAKKPVKPVKPAKQTADEKPSETKPGETKPTDEKPEEKSAGNKIWIAIILAIIILPTGIILNHYFNPPDYGEDFVRVGKVNIHFVSKIDDCMTVPIDEQAAHDLLNSVEFISLFDPDGSEKYGTVTYEAQRILYPLGHRPYSAYTKPYKNDSTSVRTLQEGTASLPIILFEIGDETAVRRYAPGQIVISGRDEDEIYHAACRLNLEILKIVYEIKLPKAPQ